MILGSDLGPLWSFRTTRLSIFGRKRCALDCHCSCGVLFVQIVEMKTRFKRLSERVAELDVLPPLLLPSWSEPSNRVPHRWKKRRIFGMRRRCSATNNDDHQRILQALPGAGNARSGVGTRVPVSGSLLSRLWQRLEKCPLGPTLRGWLGSAMPSKWWSTPKEGPCPRLEQSTASWIEGVVPA